MLGVHLDISNLLPSVFFGVEVFLGANTLVGCTIFKESAWWEEVGNVHILWVTIKCVVMLIADLIQFVSQTFSNL